MIILFINLSYSMLQFFFISFVDIQFTVFKIKFIIIKQKSNREYKK